MGTLRDSEIDGLRADITRLEFELMPERIAGEIDLNWTPNFETIDLLTAHIRTLARDVRNRYAPNKR